MRRDKSGGQPIFVALIIFGLIGWYIYNHYLKDTRRSMGPAYKIEATRKDIYRIRLYTSRLLLPMPGRFYQQKAAAIDHDLFIAAHPPPSQLEAVWSIKYAWIRIVGWFMALFLAQTAPLAAAILFICLMIVSSRKKLPQDNYYSGLRLRKGAYTDSFSLRRASCHHLSLYGLVKGINGLSQTAKAILGILAAHEEWPASIRGHMSGAGGLIDHTEGVLTEAIKLVEEGRGDIKDLIPLDCAVIVALAHDIGKIVVYKKQGDSWVSEGRYHDSLGSFILSSLPEFHKEYNGVEKESILLAVRFHHSPLVLPLNGPPLARKLLKVLQKADNIAGKREGEMGELKEDISPQLENAFDQTLPVLNINRWQGGKADGWMWGSMVFVLEHALREGIYRYLDEKIRGWFPVGRKDGKVHPLWPVIANYLTSKGILATEINGIKSNNGFFDLKVDGTVFQMVVALDSAGLEMPEEWNLGQQVNIEVLGGKDD